MNEKVLVIISTYNGSKYIRDQLNSIISQENAKVDILVRDDGSTDDTVEIIRRFYPEVKVIEGDNLGFKLSFMTALFQAPLYKYYAFCDQDDVWLPTKISTAITKLREYDGLPAFYCCNLNAVNEKLEFLYNVYNKNKPIDLSYEKLLIEPKVYGCTMVFNNLLRSALMSKASDRIPHDYWVSLVGAFLGKGIYDSNPYIQYRQHGNNTIGVDHSLSTLIRSRLVSAKKLLTHKTPNRGGEKTVREFYKAYKDQMNPEQKKTVLKIINYRKNIWSKLKLLFDFNIRMSTLEKDLSYRIRIIFSAV